jgi:predicted DNA binding CopG/RHH family protein
MNKLMAVEPVVYTENDEIGELEVIQDDFLPSPQELAARAKRGTKVKVTITLESASIDYFKRVAREQNVSYQKMIRMLLDEYVQRQKLHDSGTSTR